MFAFTTFSLLKKNFLFRHLFFSLCLLTVFSVRAHATTFMVTKTADTSDGVCNSDCSLREAIIAANNNGSGADTINFSTGSATPATSSISFSQANYSQNESGMATVVVKRSSSLSAYSVNYSTQDGTAKAGLDYTTKSGVLNFNAGELSKTIDVTILSDALDEYDEDFTVVLSNVPPDVTVVAPTTAKVTISDNDAPPIMHIDDFSAPEGNSGTKNFAFNVSLDQPSGKVITVDFYTFDVSAHAGSDYQTVTGTQIFDVGQTQKTIVVPVKGDTDFEGDETFGMHLNNAQNSSLVSNGEAAGVIIDDDVTGATTVEFSQATYSVQEDLTAVSITVTRSGDTSGSASVNYSTNDDLATQKGDFEYAAGRLEFAPGETSKDFKVLINEDMYFDSNEVFTVSLSNPTGAALGQQSTATVSIIDDAPESINNPIDDAQSFVSMQYHDFLNREPDAGGLAFWTNEITSCGGDQQCIDTKRVNVSAAFFLSIEFQQTGYLVHRTYKAALDLVSGMPVPVKLNDFMTDTQVIGKGVVVNQPGWQQVLENNKQAFFAAFVQRALFTQEHPTSWTPAQFVDALFSNAGVTPSVAERQAAIDEFGGAATSADQDARARALRRVAENPTLAQQEFNKAFVLMQYFGYLRRNPNDAPEPGLNYDGYNFWLNKLNQFNGNYQNAEMVKAFIISGEYRQRFGP